MLNLTTEKPMDDDDLTRQHLKGILPASVRLTFPVEDLPPTALHEVAKILRDLAWACEELAHQRDIPERHRMWDYSIRLEEARDRIKRNAKLNGIVVREGRPPTNGRAAQIENREGTVSGDEIRKPQQFVSRGLR